MSVDTIPLTGKIKSFIRKVPVIGSFLWWAYMIVKAPIKISELFAEVKGLKSSSENLESKISGPFSEFNLLKSGIDTSKSEISKFSHSEENCEDLYSCTRDGLKKYNNEGLEKDKHFFFIFGTPRSGTRWFSHFFTTNEVFCFHELSLLCHGNLQKHVNALMKFKPIPQSITKDTLDSQLRRLLYLYPSFGRLMYHKLYESEQYVACGNSDCGLVYFPRALQKVFPKSRFLIILRNGFDVALSLEKKMKENTEMSIENYNKLYGYQCKNFFEIACWRWRRETEKLFEESKHLTPNRTIIISFEKVFSDVEVLRDIWDFFLEGKVAFDRQRAEALLNERINVGAHQKPIGKTVRERWASLDTERRDSFLRIAGSFMKSLPNYESWPDLDF